jgi:hypothetical protein
MSYGLQISYNPDGTVSSISYNQLTLLDAIKQTGKGITYTHRQVKLPTTLVTIIDDVLDEITRLPHTDNHKKLYLADKLFEHINFDTGIPNPIFRHSLYKTILEHVISWEKSHESIHKGSLYYFMSESSFRSGNITAAYTYLYNAVEEDKQYYGYISKSYYDSPAYKTSSLIDDPNNYVYTDEVKTLRDMLRNYILDYNTHNSKSFTIHDLDIKLLQNKNLEDIKRFFVSTIREIYDLNSFNISGLLLNDYSKLKIVDVVLNLALVVDKLLEHKFTGVLQKKNMANAIYQLALFLKWTSTTGSKDVRLFLRLIKPSLNSGNPDKILPPILNNSATFEGIALSDSQKAIFATYHLRNYASHNIKGNAIVVTDYNRVMSLIMDALFLSLEIL